MDDSTFHELSDTRTVVMVLLHLQLTHHRIDPVVHSSNDLVVNLFFHHLFQHNFAELIDRIVCASPPTVVVPDCILEDLHRVLSPCSGVVQVSEVLDLHDELQ